MSRYVDPTPKYTDTTNKFMPYGLLYFYDSGTNVEKTTYADVNETIANTQPLILNGDGSVPNCFYSGSAKVVLVTNAGTQAAPIDGTQQWEKDPVTSGAIGAIGTAWDAVSIYDLGSVVIYNNAFYVSIVNSNQNNIPTPTSTSWTLFYLLKLWNINETYGLGEPVLASNGFLYTSAINGNLGDDPTLDSGNWSLPAVRAPKNLLYGNFRVNQRVVSGTVVLSSGEYGHDRFRAGSGGCTYTFATATNVTTITISAGTLEQEIEGLNITTGTHVLSWAGTVQGQIDGGGFAATGVTATLTGGTNAIVEFNTGTISLPQLEVGSNESAFDSRPIGDEESLCKRYYQKSYDSAVAPATSTSVGQVSFEVSTAETLGHDLLTRLEVEMRTSPTVVIYSPNDGSTGNMYFSTSGNRASTATVSSKSINVSNSVQFAADISDQAAYQYIASAEL